jgi:hypothetical protein
MLHPSLPKTFQKFDLPQELLYEILDQDIAYYDPENLEDLCRNYLGKFETFEQLVETYKEQLVTLGVKNFEDELFERFNGMEIILGDDLYYFGYLK